MVRLSSEYVKNIQDLFKEPAFVPGSSRVHIGHIAEVRMLSPDNEPVVKPASSSPRSRLSRAVGVLIPISIGLSLATVFFACDSEPTGLHALDLQLVAEGQKIFR